MASQGPSRQMVDTNSNAQDQVLPWDSLHRGKHTSLGTTPTVKSDGPHPAQVLLWVRRWGQKEDPGTALCPLKGLRSAPDCVS